MAKTIDNKVEESGKGSLNKRKRAAGLKRFGIALLSTAVIFGASQVYGWENYPSNLLKTDRWRCRDYYKDKVVFTANVKDKPKINYEIFTAHEDGSGQKRLTYTEDFGEYAVFWTDDGERIFGWGTDENSNMSYFIMDEDGSNKQDISMAEFAQLTNGAAERIRNGGRMFE